MSNKRHPLWSGASDNSWSVAQVSEKLNVGRNTIAKYLAGTQYPSLVIARRIQSEYGWHVHDQIDLHPDMGYDPAYGVEFRNKLNEYYKMAKESASTGMVQNSTSNPEAG